MHQEYKTIIQLKSELALLRKQIAQLKEKELERERMEEALHRSQEELEKQITERTADLLEANKKLQQQISECRQVEKALFESETRFKDLAELSPFPISLIDSSGKYLYINKRFTEIFGYTLEDIPTGKEWFNLAYPDPKYRKEAIFFWKSDLAKLKKGMVSLRVFTVKCKDSSIRDIIYRPIAMDDGNWFIIYEDITDRKRAEEELSQAKEYLEKIFESVTDSIIVTNINTIIMTCNNATEKIFGYKKETLIGKSIKILYPNNKAFKEMLYHYKKKMSGKGFYAGEMMHKHRQGNLIPISLRSSMLIGTSGNPMGIVWAGRDITEQKQAEKAKAKLESQLRHAQKMEAIGTLAGGIAHDFGNIFSNVLGYAELAIHDFPSGSEARLNLEQIIMACKRSREMVKQILTFSRKIKPESKPIHILPIVDDALKFVHGSLPNNIKIKKNCDFDCGVIMADPTQIHQVILNLCTNAYQAMADQGGVMEVSFGLVEIGKHNHVEIQDLKEGRYLKLSISDTGHGIHPSDLERIFDPFFTTKAPGEGTGLGLSTVHGIVKAHKGTICVNSEVGKGTTFTVYLPALEKTAETEALKPKPTPNGKEHILLVDDEKPLINVGKIALERLGYKVTATTSSVDALAIFNEKRNEFDIVVTDQRLPDINGIRLAQELLRIRPGIPIILTSGFDKIIAPEKAKAIGIREFIMKPFLARELAQVIRHVLDQEKI